MNNFALIKLKEAITKEELADYILGKGEYLFVNPLLETPTDLDTIFLFGFNKYSQSDEEKRELNDKITQALIEISKTPVGLWWVIFFCCDYYFGYIDGALQFTFDADSVVKQINQMIPMHKDALKLNKEFVGYQFDGGLWENIENMTRKLNPKLKGAKILL